MIAGRESLQRAVAAFVALPSNDDFVQVWCDGLRRPAWADIVGVMRGRMSVSFYDGRRDTVYFASGHSVSRFRIIRLDITAEPGATDDTWCDDGVDRLFTVQQEWE